MENISSLELLNQKVTQILQNYHSLKEENELLRNEVMTIKAQSEIKDQELEKLREENLEKDIEIEEIVAKIESMLG